MFVEGISSRQIERSSNRKADHLKLKKTPSSKFMPQEMQKHSLHQRPITRLNRNTSVSNEAFSSLLVLHRMFKQMS